LCDPEVATANSPWELTVGSAWEEKTTVTKAVTVAMPPARIDFEGGRAYAYRVKVREIVQMLKDDGWLLVRTR
jgi:hypothetical protein